jgi:hypothetical protein
MRKRIGTGLAAVAAGLAVLAGGFSPAQDKDKKDAAPKWVDSYDLISRPGGKRDFNPSTPRVGVEFFQDEATGARIAITQAGAIAVSAAKPAGDRKMPWLTGVDLSVRKAGEAEFTQKTAKFGVEVFSDAAAGQLVYLCQSGAIAFAPAPKQGSDKGPKFHHGLTPKVRNADQTEFTDARQFGVEAYTDQGHDALLYVTETGGLAAAPAAPPLAEGEKVKRPVPVDAFLLKVRKANEVDFSDKTKKVPVEVFEDPNANTLLYITETGSIAVVPKPAKYNNVPEGQAAPPLVRSANLTARKAGEKDFAKAHKYGVEVFKDLRTGNLIFVTDTGSIAVLPVAK